MGQCYNSVVVPAPVEDVWKALGNFHDMSWAPNVITKLEVVGDKSGTEVGAKRKLNEAFEETLIDVNDKDRSFAYSIDDGPAPLNSEAMDNYIGAVKVFSVTATGQTFVLWTSDYVTRDDGAVGEFCNPMYQALLNELVAHFS